MNATITLYLQQQPSFYDHLVQWDVIAQLLDHFEQSEQEQALNHIVASLDVVVHDTVFHHLPAQYHTEYLEWSHQRHQDPALLEWLETKQTGITLTIKETVWSTKHSLAQVLEIELPQFVA